MSLTDVTTDARRRLEPARERVSGAVESAREATAPARERVGDAAALAALRAREAADAAAPRLESARDATRPAVTRVKEATVEGAGVVADLVPSILERIVAVLRALFGDLEERGRELAYQVEPPRRFTRRNRTKLAAWFAGGFVVGAGAGWFAHRRFASQGIHGAQDIDEHTEELGRANSAPYAEDVAAIDARREDVSFN